MLMLADETIVFATFDAIALIRMRLKIAVTNWMDSPHPNSPASSIKTASRNAA
jgi:hypothetical protein